MEREWLQQRLAAGASIEAIAREVDRDPSTVSYWARKHGLTSSHAPRHAARGPIERELLAEIVSCELSVREMADVFERSPTTIRYWLDKHEIKSDASIRRGAGVLATKAGAATPHLPCPTHGVTRHVPRADGSFRCTQCRSEQVAEHRRRVKRQLVEEAGGRCLLCGYDRYLAALQFHHVDPDAKRFAISRGGVTRALCKAREEATKCVLLCANCHAEVEGGFAQLPLRSADPPINPA